MGEAELSKKPTKELDKIQDASVFLHRTGDLYGGSFEARKKDRSLKMHALGLHGPRVSIVRCNLVMDTYLPDFAYFAAVPALDAVALRGNVASVSTNVASQNRARSRSQGTIVIPSLFITSDYSSSIRSPFNNIIKEAVARNAESGPGVYKSAQGDTYTGIWDSDKLSPNEPVTISHLDGSKYEGYFKDWQYFGQGQYYYPDGSVLEGKFSENSPIGALKVVDPNGHAWLGKAELGFGWFEPVNHFYELLEERTADVIKEHRKKKRNVEEHKKN